MFLDNILPLSLSCVVVRENRLLIGTSKGQLLVYEIPNEKFGNPPRFRVDLKETKKTFSKKPIVQVNVVEGTQETQALSSNL